MKTEEEKNKENRRKLSISLIAKNFLYFNGFITDAESNKIFKRIGKFQNDNDIIISSEQLDSADFVYNDNAERNKSIMEIEYQMKITSVNLYKYNYDRYHNAFPVRYRLLFNFRSQSIIAVFNVNDMRSGLFINEYIDAPFYEKNSNLIDSFNDKLKDPIVGNAIRSECVNFWKEYDNNDGVYDYLGYIY